MWWRRARYLLLLIALCAIATCPAAQRACTANRRATEARALLGYLADRVAAQVVATGRVPATAAGPTPRQACCEQGGSCRPDAAAWATAGWRELGFSIDGPHRFTYQYLPDPGGLSATLRATGDVACDRRPSLVELQLTVVGGQLARVWSRGAAAP
jgi:hypothetical protein